MNSWNIQYKLFHFLHDIFLLQRTTIHFVKVLHLRKQSRHGSCWNITHYHLHCHCNKKRHIVSVWLRMKLSRDFSKLWSLNLKTGLQTINWNREWNLTRLIKQQAHVDLTYKRQNKNSWFGFFTALLAVGLIYCPKLWSLQFLAYKNGVIIVINLQRIVVAWKC